jgi:hypothetical protein
MRIVALLTLALIAADPVWAQQSAVAPERPLRDSIPPLDKDTLGLMLRALSQQQPDIETLKGNSGAGVWQMLGATVGSAPAVWLLNSSSGQLLFCTLGLQNSPGVICYTTPTAR